MSQKPNRDNYFVELGGTSMFDAVGYTRDMITWYEHSKSFGIKTPLPESLPKRVDELQCPLCKTDMFKKTYLGPNRSIFLCRNGHQIALLNIDIEHLIQ